MKRVILIITILGIIIGVGLAKHATSQAEAGVCDLWIGQVWAAPEGTESDGVVGACSFDWKGTATIQAYAGKRWHIIGTHKLSGGRAGVIYQSSLFRDPEYEGCGAWRVSVLAEGHGDEVRVDGPVSRFCAGGTQ